MAAVDGLEAMPMSPRQSPSNLAHAIVAWARSRRGRTLAMSAVFMVVLLAIMGARQSETISSSYHDLSSNYLPSWRPHLPPISSSPLKPSNTTIELENDKHKTVPSQLKKATPNFHLVMASLEDSPEFCKTTMSAMILNYPPPTIINLYQTFASQPERQRARLKSLVDYLRNGKLVKDDDLVLIVDGQDTWFHLPSEVIIRQYETVVMDANKRLLERYGYSEAAEQRYNQTIVFGAEKTCDGDDLACKYAPESILPKNIYGSDTLLKTETTPARYLDSGMMMGPAKDLGALCEAAVRKFDGSKSQARTIQSVFATMFGEQQLARDAERKSPKLQVTADPKKWFSWFGGRAGAQAETPTEEVEAEPTANVTLEKGQNYEFSIGLDYSHTLFQTILHAAPDELVPLTHDKRADHSEYHRPDTPTPSLTIPTALLRAQPPFWTPDLAKHNPSPNDRPSVIEPLQLQKDLDTMKPRDTSWAEVQLIQNTYTGTIPAVFHLNLPTASLQSRGNTPPTANLTWSSLWFSGYERALLRKHFRLPQSAIGFHAAAVGGDNMWDQRGGRGGVWTAEDSIWLPWGETDGVCGTLTQLQHLFTDGKGVWLHEKEGKQAEGDRKAEEKELKKKIEEIKLKDKEKEDKKYEEERKKKIAEEKKKADKAKEPLLAAKKQKEEEERKKKEGDEQRKKEEDERKTLEEEARKKKEEGDKTNVEEERKKKEAEAAKAQMQEEKKQQDEAKKKEQPKEERPVEVSGTRRRRWVA